MAAHRYWRLNITANNGSSSNVTVAEMQYRTSVGGANQATGGTASATNSLGGFEPSKAFDGDASTFWVSSSGPTVYLAYQFATAKDIVEYTMAARNDNSSYLTDTPQDWLLQYSDDGTTWKTAQGESGQTGWSLGEVRTFSALPKGKALKPLRPAVETTTPSAKVLQIGKAPATNAKTVSGTVTVGGVATSGLLVRAYAKATGEFVGEATTAGDGTYSINCGGYWKDVYVIAFDPTTYRAVTYDQIVPG